MASLSLAIEDAIRARRDCALERMTVALRTDALLSRAARLLASGNGRAVREADMERVLALRSQADVWRRHGERLGNRLALIDETLQEVTRQILALEEAP